MYSTEYLMDLLGHQRLWCCMKRGSEFEGSFLSPEDDISSMNDDGWDAYVVLNPVRAGVVGMKPKDADIISHKWILMDIDAVGQPIDLEDITPYFTKFLRDADIGKHELFFTGRGCQIWLEVEPSTDILKSVRQTKQFLLDSAVYFNVQGKFRLDTCTSEASRLARWPGSLNHKTKLSGMLWATDVGNKVLQRNRLREAEVPPPPPPPKKFANLSDLSPRLTWTANQFLFWGVETGRHSAAYASARALKDCGVSEEEAIKYVVRGGHRCSPPLPEQESCYCVKSAYRSGQ